MDSSESQYSYTSQLPLMFTMIDQGRTPKPGIHGLTKRQRQLWNTVGQNRNRVLGSNAFKDEESAIQEYMLELWTWNRYWPREQFPGDAPEEIGTESVPQDPVGPSNYELETVPEPDGNVYTYTPSSLLTQYYPFNTAPELDPSREILLQPPSSPTYTPPPPVSPPTRYYPTIQPPSEDSLRAECREAILKQKGKDYIPYHGWDEETGLPRYSIICLASNGFYAFCGPRQDYFQVIKQHFSPIARIMYQRARTGLMVIWTEAPGMQHVAEFRKNAVMWDKFKACWAFLKCWSDAAGEGGADNVADFLMGWRGDERLLEGLRMDVPPSRVYNAFGH